VYAYCRWDIPFLLFEHFGLLRRNFAMQLHGFLGALAVCAVLTSLISAKGRASAQATPGEQRIRNIIQNEASAWTSGDAAAYSRDFAADGVFTNILGQFSIGHEAFLKQHEYIFKGPYRGTTAQLDIVSLKFVRPDVAIVHVLTSVTGFESLAPGLAKDSKGRLRTRLMQVLVRENGTWRIVDYHNVDVKAQTPVPDPEAIKPQ
jgi:uncharacterized protein (TIGR02246 family)